jgi:hypothetical protein
VKFAACGEAVATFRGWGYPGWLAPGVGVAELAGAAGVLLGARRTVWGASLRFWSAAGLAPVMVAAVVTHLRWGPVWKGVLATALLAASVSLALRVRPERVEVRF